MFGENDERILPAGNPERQAIETLKADFPALSSAGIQVVLRGTRGAAPLRRALAFIVPYWRRLALVLAISLASTALSLYLPLLSRDLVDGVLVGGASLDPRDFAKIAAA